MPSIVSSFEYDIFISYRHNDNRSGWVTEFVNALQEELAATIKESITIWGTIIFELIVFAGLFMDKRFKKWLLVGGILFHFFTVIIHGLASFFFTMTAALILYLIPIGVNSKELSNIKVKLQISYTINGQELSLARRHRIISKMSWVSLVTLVKEMSYQISC